jgi:hypothetical protein
VKNLDELYGDPLRLAEMQFRLAHKLCGTCRDYHATWAYRRLSGLYIGIDGDDDILQARLRTGTPENGCVLICGSADAGQLALVAHATAGLSPRIDVADRCPTPLAVCRAYAEREGIAVETFALDLSNEVPDREYDLILAHLFVHFLPLNVRVEFFRRLASRMARGAVLIVAELERAYARVEIENLKIVRALAERGVTLPEDEASFLKKFENVPRSRGPRHEAVAPGALRAALLEAGFRIDGWDEHRRRTTAHREAVARENLTFVATASLA